MVAYKKGNSNITYRTDRFANEADYYEEEELLENYSPVGEFFGRIFFFIKGFFLFLMTLAVVPLYLLLVLPLNAIMLGIGWILTKIILFGIAGVAYTWLAGEEKAEAVGTQILPYIFDMSGYGLRNFFPTTIELVLFSLTVLFFTAMTIKSRV